MSAISGSSQSTVSFEKFPTGAQPPSLPLTLRVHDTFESFLDAIKQPDDEGDLFDMKVCDLDLMPAPAQGASNVVDKC